MQKHIQVTARISQQIKETEDCSTFLRFALGSLSD
jgi:hypothetical protein